MIHFYEYKHNPEAVQIFLTNFMDAKIYSSWQLTHTTSNLPLNK